VIVVLPSVHDTASRGLFDWPFSGCYEFLVKSRCRLGCAMSTYTLAEVAKHTAKDDCWVVLDGKVLNVTSFLKDHPGGELAILTFAGKDATAEFNMIHPPDVVSKYAPDTVIGTVGGGEAPAAAVEAPKAVAAVPVAAVSAATLGASAEKVDNCTKFILIIAAIYFVILFIQAERHGWIP